MKSERIVAFNDEIWKDTKRYQKLCEFYNLYLQIRYYGDGDVCFSGISENDDEIFMVSIRYYKNERRFYIGLNSQLEKYRNNGSFRKEETLEELKKSYDILNIEYLKMKKLLIKLLRGERLTEEERLDVTILNLLDKHFNKELENEKRRTNQSFRTT